MVCVYILPYLKQYSTFILPIYTLEKSSNLDSSVETKVIEIIVLLKELDNGRHS